MKDYHINIFYCEEDEGYIADIPDLKFCSGGATPEAALGEVMIAKAFLPPQLRSLARDGSAEAFARTFRIYLEGGDYKRFAVLDTIYQIDNEYVRPALIDILRNAPFKPNYFQRLRHIFKMAQSLQWELV